MRHKDKMEGTEDKLWEDGNRDRQTNGERERDRLEGVRGGREGRREEREGEGGGGREGRASLRPGRNQTQEKTT